MAERLPLAHLHRNNNRESADLWQRFTGHRNQVTTLALSSLDTPSGSPPPARSLAVLGAGNCNDLDLDALAARFQQIHLVDIDDEALRRARARQSAEVASRLILHAPVDLSGAFDRLDGFRRKPATAVELANLPRLSQDSVRQALPGAFDVVLSTCFLSQLMQSAYVALGPEHRQLHLIACALALAHLRAVAALLAPGGTAHLVTDAVSTETYPLVELWERESAVTLLERLEKTDNVFSGTGPAFLRRILATDKQVAPLLAAPPRLAEPWLWSFTEDRTYLVYALSFQRKVAAPT